MKIKKILFSVFMIAAMAFGCDAYSAWVHFGHWLEARKTLKEKGEKYGVHCCHYLFCFVILCCKSSIIFAKTQKICYYFITYPYILSF